MSECDHKYVQLETWVETLRGPGQSSFTLFREFFCERCLKTKILKEHENGYEMSGRFRAISGGKEYRSDL